jgi:hypothetical protein
MAEAVEALRLKFPSLSSAALENFRRCRWWEYRGMLKVLVAVAAVLLLAACGEEKPKNVLKEAIDVQGTCREDHVQQSDEYAGQIVRWQMADTGKIAAYGFVLKKGDFADHVVGEVTHPNVYHTPQQISFLDTIDIDTSQPKWTLHGVSDRGTSPEDAIQGYNSTCSLEVVKRGMEIRLPMDLAGATKK